MFEYDCSLEFGSRYCPSTVLWMWGSCCWWLKLGLCEANAASNDGDTTPSDIFLMHLIQFFSPNIFIMTFQMYHTIRLQFITSTVTSENFDYFHKNLNFKVCFGFWCQVLFLFWRYLSFRLIFYLFFNVISQPVNSRYIGLNLEGKYHHTQVITKKRLEFKTNMCFDAILIQSGINSFIFSGNGCTKTNRKYFWLPSYYLPCK